MSVVERLQYLLDTGQFSDVNVRVGQGNNVTVFKAHRLLLATASQSLYKLVHQVNPHPGPNDITTIRVTDMKPSDFQHILRYIYTDNIDCKNISVAFELLRASKKWGLAGLGIKSLTFLEEFVENFVPTTEEAKSNLFDLLVLSEETLRETSDKCWQILLKNPEILIPCEGYLKLDKRMVKKVICHKDLKITDQLKLFLAIRDWGLRYIQEHKLTLAHLGDVVEELIKAVDFEKISDTDFLSTVLTSECLGKAEVIAFFMTHGLEIPRNLDFNNNKQLPFWMCLHASSEQDKGPRTPGKQSKRSNNNNNNNNTTTNNNNLSTVSETLSKICSLTQNGSVLEFNKVCRFRKGYRCPQKEINQEHELRFRVDKNIKLLGVSFGFLFSATDMGINVHCQGPWETRQWTDISQAYCRVSGDKQETADVRLMFLQPVRIEANQSYKVLVKTVRMSQGISEVELWGGTGGLYCVETEDAEFYFIKAAVDPTKSVEENEGDTKPGMITELLYQLDTSDPDEHKPYTRRRRATEVQEEDLSNTATNTIRQRQRPDSLKIPEVPYQRKRSPPSDDFYKTPDVPPLTRRRESNDITRKTSMEEYIPTSFSTNRWKSARRREEEDGERKKSVEEYVPSSFSTNRWRTTKPKEENNDEAERKRSVEEYKPSSFTTNRWRTTRGQEDDKGETRKTSTEENRWRPRPQQEDKKDTPFGNRLYNKKEEETKSTSNHPFMRRRESKESTEVPFYMRRSTTTQQDENKGTVGALGRSSRFGASSSTTNAEESRGSSRLYRPDTSTSTQRTTGSSSLLSSRYGRESSLTRPRDSSSSLSRFSSGSSYLSRYDNVAKSNDSSGSSVRTNQLSVPLSDSRYSGSVDNSTGDITGRTNKGSTESATIGTSGSRYGRGTASPSRYGRDTTPSSRYTRDKTPSSKYARDTTPSSRYGRDTTPSTKYGRETTPSSSRYSTNSSNLTSSKYNTDSTYKPGRYGTDSTTSSRYGTTKTESGGGGAGSRYSSPARQVHKYGTSTTLSGSNLASLGTRSGEGQRKYGSSVTGSAGNLGGGVGGTGTSSSKYGSSLSSGLVSSLSGKYSSPLSGSGGNKFGTGYCYTSPAPPTRVTSRGAGLSSYTSNFKYGSSSSSPSSSSLGSSRYSSRPA
ncbi:hypothetical protein Pmani_013037 [Petrolisthes manimaculis]|uniref:BTB domain-containing protein n=1 Tax=Petrolisthes manimaculis TaxID=1843537 RepID=A0AAE1PY25_9EUCA|nr:hypothetical protein Pmani_013037 [Petrolisthes manimaculis]